MSSRFSKLSDPEVFGPGMWHSIHSLARLSDMTDKQDNYIKIVKYLLQSIRCDECKGHALAYYKENNPRNYKGTTNKEGEEIGMFMWSWKFHNDVNFRLNKPIVDWETAYFFYSDIGSGSCKSTCSASH
jgi:hypothetical protein